MPEVNRLRLTQFTEAENKYRVEVALASRAKPQPRASISGLHCKNKRTCAEV